MEDNMEYEIDIYTDDAGLFGDQSTNNLDVLACYDEYEAQVERNIRWYYPAASIKFHRGETMMSVTVDGYTDTETVSVIQNVIADVYANFNWLVRKE
jgi:hypothetical protein